MNTSQDRVHNRKKTLLIRGTGTVIVVFWVVMMGALVLKNKVNNTEYLVDNKSKTKSAITTKIMGREREWMEVFLNRTKIGYSLNQIQPLDAGYAVHDSLFLQLNVLGRPNVIRSETQALVDNHFRLRRFRFSMHSGVTQFEITGEVNRDALIIKQKGSPDRKLRLEGPLFIGASLDFYFRGEDLALGRSFRIPFFDPSTLSRKTIVVRVSGREDIRIHGIPYKSLRLETEIMGQPAYFWLDDKGSILKETGLMGMTLVRSNPTQAPKDISGGGGDLYELVSIRPDRRLPRPRQLTCLKLNLEGLSQTTFDTTALGGGRQRYQRNGDLEVTAEDPPASGSYSLPYTNLSEEMGKYLRPELTIESDDPGIQDKAREIARGGHDPVRVARRLMTWVYLKVDKRPVLSVPSAREVLVTRVGDCNEHAVLLAAFLRASGIPARVCAGLVYVRGNFYYHAWTEGYVGKWLSMDATLDQMPADATHITLARGDLDSQTTIISLIGKLKIKVLDYRYD
jgi:Transglutaminase-like superfamily